MSARFCSQCGKEIPEGYSFCAACGAVQRGAVQAPYPGYQQPNQTNPQPYQQPNKATQQTYQPPNQTNPQPYQPPYQAGQQFGYNVPRVTSVKATGLIVGVFALVALFILAVLVFILPSKEDFALLGLEEGQQLPVSASAVPEETTAAGAPASSVKYGEPPTSILDQINVNATPEDYTGSYSGRVTFKSENLDIMTEITGDSSYQDIISKYNGKTYDCTAEIDDCICAFSPEIYSENSDGSFYTYYYYDSDLQNGIAIYEESDDDEEMGMEYYIADKAYFLTDGSVYVITITTAEFDDGRSLTSEIRLELTPSR